MSFGRRCARCFWWIRCLLLGEGSVRVGTVAALIIIGVVAALGVVFIAHCHGFVVLVLLSVQNIGVIRIIEDH